MNGNIFSNNNVFHNSQNNLENLLCIPSTTHLPVSIQGFFSEPCCCSNNEKQICEKKINLTQLTPSTLYQCKSNLGVTFTNSANGPPCHSSSWNTDFVPISSFSNFSINGLNSVRRVIIQNISNYDNPFNNYCSVGPTIPGNPLGKINNKLGLFEYNVCTDNFKFGPVHLGLDNWLQAIPSITQKCDIKDKYVTVDYKSKYCNDHNDSISYNVLTVPLQLRLIFLFECGKKTLILNLSIYLLTCEGPCEIQSKHECSCNSESIDSDFLESCK
jgi:hypothetical protein